MHFSFAVNSLGSHRICSTCCRQKHIAWPRLRIIAQKPCQRRLCCGIWQVTCEAPIRASMRIPCVDVGGRPDDHLDVPQAGQAFISPSREGRGWCGAFITPSANSRPKIMGPHRKLHTGPFPDKQQVPELTGMWRNTKFVLFSMQTIQAAASKTAKGHMV